LLSAPRCLVHSGFFVVLLPSFILTPDFWLLYSSSSNFE
jgi:hypothetical protein